MNTKRNLPSYEDFFKLPVSDHSAANDQHHQAQSGSGGYGSNLRDAASILVSKAVTVLKTALRHPDSAEFVSELASQQITMAFDGGSQGQVGGQYEPECLRPLETSESYREPNLNMTMPRNTGPWDNQTSGQYGMGQGQMRSTSDDYSQNYDRQNYYDQPYQYHDDSDRQDRYLRYQEQQGMGRSYEQHREYQTHDRMERTYQQHGPSGFQEPGSQDKDQIHGRMERTYQQHGPSGFQEPGLGSQDKDQTHDRMERTYQQHGPSGFQESGSQDQTPAMQENEEEDDDEEDTTYCKLCDVHFDEPQKFVRHTRGMLHTQRHMEAEKAKLGVTEEDINKDKQLAAQGWKPPPPASQTNRSGAEQGAGDNAGDGENEEDWDEECEREESFNPNILICELCDITTTGIQAMRAHEAGRAHKQVQEAVENGTLVPQRCYSKLGPKAKIPEKCKPVTAAVLGLVPVQGSTMLLNVMKNVPEAVVGMEYVKEGHSGKQATFMCTICESLCDVAAIVSHLIGSKHRMKYLRAQHPTIYEHVRSHGGKKSQLSTFLEQVCSDVEKKEGRKQSMKSDSPATSAKTQPKEEKEGAGAGIEGEEKEETERKSEEKSDEAKSVEPKGPAPQDKAKRSDKNRSQSNKRRLSHDAVMAKYELARSRGRFEDGPDDHYGPDHWGGPEHRFGPDGPGQYYGPGGPDWRFGPGGPNHRFGPDWPCGPMGPDGPPDRPFRPDGPIWPFGPGGPVRPGLDGPYDQRGWRDPRFDVPRGGPGEPFPPPYPPEPFLMSEEERLRRMQEYEAHLFNHPMLLVTPEEARHIMFSEYEKLGIPYDIACDRVLIQEDKRIKLMDQMKDGLSLKEAQTRIRRVEKRKLLILEYEKQGLDSREARWKAIAEEERDRLYDKYDEMGFTILEARAKIMAGEDRMHFISEFERNGMSPEEAYQRAISEEERLRKLDAPGQEEDIDELADQKMLQSFLSPNNNREQAENKMIAVLRRQGVSTQDAILRVQKIKLPEKKRTPSPPPPRRERDSSSKDKEKKKKENLDEITPEEAKERLFREYEKRGVPREKARLTLIQELVKSGVSHEEAERRFADTRPITTKERREKRKKGYERGRSRSSSSDRSSQASSSYKRKRRSPSVERKVMRGDYGKRLLEEKRRQEVILTLQERDREGASTSSKDGERRGKSKEPPSRPTLTLGEEIKLKAKKLRRAELLRTLEENASSSKQTKVDSAQEKSKPGAKDETSVSNLLETLTDDLISSENDSAALSMSKALTSALMKYRLNSEAGPKEKVSSASSPSSFVERRIQDAKKLFETKVLMQKEDKGRPSGARTVRPESFGLPPPLPARVQSSSFPPPRKAMTTSNYQTSVPPYPQKSTLPAAYSQPPSSTESSSYQSLPLIYRQRSPSPPERTRHSSPSSSYRYRRSPSPVYGQSSGASSLQLKKPVLPRCLLQKEPSKGRVLSSRGASSKDSSSSYRRH